MSAFTIVRPQHDIGFQIYQTSQSQLVTSLQPIRGSSTCCSRESTEDVFVAMAFVAVEKWKEFKANVIIIGIR